MVGLDSLDHLKIRYQDAYGPVDQFIPAAAFHLLHYHLGRVKQHPVPDGALRLYLHLDRYDFAGTGVELDIQDAQLVFKKLPVQVGIKHGQALVFLGGQVQHGL